MTQAAGFYNPETAEYFDPKETHRVAIVSGGNSGIGWYTVLHLYLHGYAVYVVGRNESRVKKAIKDIEDEARRRTSSYDSFQKKTRHLGSMEYIHFDCCDLESVERCATAFLSKERRLHVLINNAGVMGIPFEITKDGYEIQYQVNLVAPFLFTLNLLPALKAAKSDAVPRVLTLSSVGHNAAYRYFDPSDHINHFPLMLYTWIRYGNAKCAAIQFMKKFAANYPGILAFSIHPGVIGETELYSWWDKLPFLGSIFHTARNVAGYFIGVSSEEGSLATLRAAMDQSLGEDDSGSYLITGGSIIEPSRVALNKDNIDTTWNRNIEMLREKGFTLLL
ncbi:hypothetical protein PUMCH_000352 [Australozyma saopauloensis]|uniref:NAD(P)-binding protein n=1 Tax=Australozyma saopauloensis TaxID=291208 RepID=A0AAX4H575_9ASCO|nr:hypothetical protein PUMCH_000352 [[Candida] saopauloensis]